MALDMKILNYNKYVSLAVIPKFESSIGWDVVHAEVTERLMLLLLLMVLMVLLMVLLLLLMMLQRLLLLLWLEGWLGSVTISALHTIIDCY